MPKPSTFVFCGHESTNELLQHRFATFFNLNEKLAKNLLCEMHKTTDAGRGNKLNEALQPYQKF